MTMKVQLKNYHHIIGHIDFDDKKVGNNTK